MRKHCRFFPSLLICMICVVITTVMCATARGQSPTGGVIKLPRKLPPPINPVARRIVRTNHSTKLNVADQVEEAIDRGNQALDKAVVLLKNQSSIEGEAARLLNEAEQQYTKASRLRPNEFRAYYGLGNVYLQGGHPTEDAEDLYRKAISLKPDYWQAYLGLGTAYAFSPSSDQQYAAAIDAFNRVIQLKSDVVEAYSRLASVYESEGHYSQPAALQKAEALYRQALLLEPDNTEHYLALGRNYVLQKRTADAIDVYEQLVKRFPNSAAAHGSLAREYKVAERYPEAIIEFKTAVRLNPNDSQSYLELAYTFDALGQYANAIETYKELLRIYPVFKDDDWYASKVFLPIARFYIGEDYLALKDKKAALEQYDELKKIDAKKAQELLADINNQH